MCLGEAICSQLFVVFAGMGWNGVDRTVPEKANPFGPRQPRLVAKDKQAMNGSSYCMSFGKKALLNGSVPFPVREHFK